MKRLACIFLVTLVSMSLPLVSSTAAGAQGGVYISQRAGEDATNIVNGQVLSTVSVMLDGEAYRVSEVAVSSSQKGQLSGSILVEVPGGERPDGTIVFVSHTPALVAGEMVQLAVRPTETYAANALPLAVGRDLEVYSVVGGTDGAFGLLPDGVGRAEAVGDYALTGASWAGFSPRVNFRVNPANSGLGESATIAGVRRAFDVWEEDLGSDIDFHFAGTTNASGVNLGDGQNTVSWVQSTSSWLAQASWITTGNGTILEFDIRVSRSFAWSNGAANGKFDIGTVLGHEVGHGIGLAHTPASSELMYFQIVSGSTKGLGSGDRSGAAFLYPSKTPICEGKVVTVDLNSGVGAPTSGPDVIYGTPDADEIDGLGGDDTICSGGGADVVRGGEGDDVINGGGGNDRLFGGPGNDRIVGGWGNDTIHGNRGQDTLAGDDGNDKIYGYAGHDYIWGGSGRDVLHGNRGADRVFGGDDDDKVFGYSENDVLEGGSGNDLIVGNFGDDQLDGGDGSDLLIGSDGTDLLLGGAQNDELNGNSGNDDLDGGPGDDFMDGGIDGDRCNGSWGGDTAVRCETTISVP